MRLEECCLENRTSHTKSCFKTPTFSFNLAERHNGRTLLLTFSCQVTDKRTRKRGATPRLPSASVLKLAQLAKLVNLADGTRKYGITQAITNLVV